MSSEATDFLQRWNILEEVRISMGELMGSEFYLIKISRMFIETLDDMLNKQSDLESNLAITRYMKANLQLTKPEFKSTKLSHTKKRQASDKTP